MEDKLSNSNVKNDLENKNYLESQEEINTYINFYIKPRKNISHLSYNVKKQMFEGIAKENNPYNKYQNPGEIAIEVYKYTLDLLNLKPPKVINNFYNDLNEKDKECLISLAWAIYDGLEKGKLFDIISDLEMFEDKCRADKKWVYYSLRDLERKIASSETLEQLIQLKYDIKRINIGSEHILGGNLYSDIIDKANKLLS
jgi:hypothetical protein